MQEGCVTGNNIIQSRVGVFPAVELTVKAQQLFLMKKKSFYLKLVVCAPIQKFQKKIIALNYFFLEKKVIFFSFLFFLNLLLNVCLLNISVSSSFLAGFWHDGVDSGRGHRVFPRVCSLLAHVFLCPVLGPDHLPLYSLPHWGSQQDLTGPLD